MVNPYSTVDIPLACQQAITASLGLPPTGGTTTPTALIATLCVLAGGALIVGTRRLALR
jgi:LPXTG-motif cell wall-anchored protein